MMYIPKHIKKEIICPNCDGEGVSPVTVSNGETLPAQCTECHGKGVIPTADAQDK